MILNHVRFVMSGSSRSWVLAAVSENDEGVVVHKLLARELTQVLAPEVQEQIGRSVSALATSTIECAARRGATAEALWQLLDDIDTMSDSISPDDLHGFYTRALDIAKKRHEYLQSDGYKLTWPMYVKNSVDSVPTAEAKRRDLADSVENAVGGYAWKSNFPENEAIVKGVAELFDAAYAATRKPVPILLYCPMCHTKHIDEGEFATRVHHTHSCQGYVMAEGKRRRCGHTWRPAIVPTVGVEALPGFINEPSKAIDT